MHLLYKRPLCPSRVVIMPNLHAFANAARSSTFSLIEAWSKFFSLYGSAFLLPVSAFEKLLDILTDCVFVGNLSVLVPED